MAYADTTFYRDTYLGRACANDDTLEKWLNRASDDIDIFCVQKFDVAELSADHLDKLKKAVCAQAESYIVYGDGDDDFESFSLGSFSVKKAFSGGVRDGVLCEGAQRYMFAAGLLFRGVRVCNRSRALY